MAVLIGAALALLASERRLRMLALAALLLVAGMYWPAPAQQEGTLRVTIAKPVIEQAALNDPRQYEVNFQSLAQLSLPAA